MTNLKKTLLGLGLLTLCAVPALAAYNIRQNGDGSADWLESSSGNVSPIGKTWVTGQISDVSTSSTAYFISPISGHVTGIVGVIDTLEDAADTLDVGINNAGPYDTINAYFTPITTNGTASFASPGYIGDVASNFNMTGFNAVNKYGVISVHSDGASGTSAIARVIIFIDPQ